MSMTVFVLAERRAAAPLPPEGCRALRVLAERLHEELDRERLGGAVGALHRAFVRGEPFAPSGSFNDPDPNLLARMGLLQRSGGTWMATLLIDRWDGLLLARHRVPSPPGGPSGAEEVGPNAKALSRLTPRRRVAAALDLGCGQGFHALQAARKASRVVGTDASRRAIRVAAINAALNGTTIDFRRGSLYEPVEGERFDLIVSNAPFVFSGVQTVTDGGPAAKGDAVSEAFVRGAPARLSPDGFGVFLCNWEHTVESEWEEPPRRWLKYADVDVWMVRLRTSSVNNVATAWFRGPQGSNRSEGGGAESLRRWRTHLRESGLGWLTMGVIFLRRRNGRTWIRGDTQWLTDGDSPAGDQVLRVFENQTLLSDAPDRARNIRWRKIGFVETGVPGSSLVHLRQTRGFRFDVCVEPRARQLLALFDRGSSIDEAVRRFQALSGIPAEHGRAVLLELIRRGYLEAVA